MPALWILDPENGRANVRSEVDLAVLDRFEVEGVESPFPPRVVATVGAEVNAPGEAPAAWPPRREAE